MTSNVRSIYILHTEIGKSRSKVVQYLPPKIWAYYDPYPSIIISVAFSPCLELGGHMIMLYDATDPLEVDTYSFTGNI